MCREGRVSEHAAGAGFADASAPRSVSIAAERKHKLKPQGTRTPREQRREEGAGGATKDVGGGHAAPAGGIAKKLTGVFAIKAMGAAAIQQTRVTKSLTSVMMTQIGAAQSRMAKCETQVGRLDAKVKGRALAMRDIQAQMAEM